MRQEPATMLVERIRGPPGEERCGRAHRERGQRKYEWRGGARCLYQWGKRSAQWSWQALRHVTVDACRSSPL
jgi:hypothetical protein